MGKKSKATVTVETLKPYVERALTDPAFRDDLKDAFDAARDLYGPLTKKDGVAGAATMVATDKKTQKQLRKTLDEVSKAAGTLQGKKSSHKVRNTALVAGVVAGALYNPWTGEQTRKWLLDKIAGDDGLQPLEGFDVPATNGGSEAPVGETVDEKA
jgi:hypothetical protein